MQQRLRVLEVSKFVGEAAKSTQVAGEVRMIRAEFALPCLDGLFQRGAFGAEGREIGHGWAFAVTEWHVVSGSGLY